MEKLKHKNELPDFKNGDTLIRADIIKGRSIIFDKYIPNYCDIGRIYSCKCKSKGTVILTTGGEFWCILFDGIPYWRKIEYNGKTKA